MMNTSKNGSPLIDGDQRCHHPEDLSSRASVDVLPSAEGIDERPLPAEVRQDAQLHLRIVYREEAVARFGDEAATDFSPFFRSDGNVLEVRLVR